MKLDIKKIVFFTISSLSSICMFGSEPPIISEETMTQQHAELHVIASFVKSFEHGLKLNL